MAADTVGTAGLAARALLEDFVLKPAGQDDHVVLAGILLEPCLALGLEGGRHRGLLLLGLGLGTGEEVVQDVVGLVQGERRLGAHKAILDTVLEIFEIELLNA